MDQTVKEIRNIFESIQCLCVEGTEFMNKSELVEVILRETNSGIKLCNGGITHDMG